MADTMDKVDFDIDGLSRQLEEEKQARREAEDGRRAAEEQTRRAVQESANRGNEAQQAQMAWFESTEDQFKTTRDILKSRYRNALAEGDHDAAADLNIEITDVSVRMLSLENGKEALKQKIENPPRPPGPRPYEQLTPSEKVDRIANGLSEKSAAWVRRHPEWTHSKQRVDALVGAHHAAEAKDLRADSPEYFAEIERILDVESTASNGVDHSEDARSSAAKAVQVRDTPPPAAPARSGGGGHTRRLTDLERDAARTSGLSEEEYAKLQAPLLKDGRITRH